MKKSYANFGSSFDVWNSRITWHVVLRKTGAERISHLDHVKRAQRQRRTGIGGGTRLPATLLEDPCDCAGLQVVRVEVTELVGTASVSVLAEPTILDPFELIRWCTTPPGEVPNHVDAHVHAQHHANAQTTTERFAVAEGGLT